MINLGYSVAAGLATWMLILMSNFAFGQFSFKTVLVGEHEVPPIFSESYGNALVVGNGDSLKYQINVTDLDQITGAFLYKGDSTENGQILVSLLNSTDPSGVIDGTLIEGTINATSVLVPVANLTTNITELPPISDILTNTTAAGSNMTNTTAAVKPINKLEALIDLMSQNMTYINIHTSDFPEGELRGSLVSTNSTG